MPNDDTFDYDDLEDPIIDESIMNDKTKFLNIIGSNNKHNIVKLKKYLKNSSSSVEEIEDIFGKIAYDLEGIVERIEEGEIMAGDGDEAFSHISAILLLEREILEKLEQFKSLLK
jgi:hypothetical protein